jgi:DNA-binding NtrC family response regulator
VGYVQEADGGTLFLDEIAELDAQVQAKLLRVLESRELLPLGSAKPRKVDFALCSATNRDLRALVAAGSMREDLYFRIASAVVTLSALRNRPEEIPALIALELARLSPAPAVHVSLVERCLLRPWPGNVRELLAEVRAAAQAAGGDRITARRLADTAGSVFGSVSPTGDSPTGVSPTGVSPSPDPHDTLQHTVPKRIPQMDIEWQRRIEDALRANAGNVTAAARALGLHRTQLRRLIERHGIAVDANIGDDE